MILGTVAKGPKSRTRLKGWELMTMQTRSIGVQCDDIASDHMKRYIHMFSQNNAFIQNGGGSCKDAKSPMLLKKVAVVEKFEKEKEEMAKKFAREKTALKNAFENEIKEYEDEINRLKMIIELKMSEIESKYAVEYKKKEDKQRLMFEVERKNLKRSIEEQMSLIAEVESELKRILKRLVSYLKIYEPQKCNRLQSDLCAPNISTSCVMWLKEMFNENSKDAVVMKSSEVKEKSIAREDELLEVGEAFRKQKKELTELFMKEKKHLEEEIKNNCLEYKKKLDREYEDRMKAEMNVWQETIKEYEREVGILRYQREHMDRNYCLEMDRLKLETEREKGEIYAKYMRERGESRKVLADSVRNGSMQMNELHDIKKD